jgi:large subunit ribosomal protein L13
MLARGLKIARGATCGLLSWGRAKATGPKWLGWSLSEIVMKIERKWHLIDVEDKILGRVATRIAKLLIGKDKVDFVPHQDVGDHVVVINAAKVAVTGKKEEQKIYYRHSRYPGALKKKTLRELREQRPEEIIARAVKGMLPKNKLQKPRMARLHIFSGAEHPYKDNLKGDK